MYWACRKWTKILYSHTFLGIYASSDFVAPSHSIWGGLYYFFPSTNLTLFYVFLTSRPSFIFSDLPLYSQHTTSYSEFIKIIITVSSKIFTPSFPQNKYPSKNRTFTGADIRNGKSSMLHESNLCTSAVGKYQSRANYELVSLWRNHFDDKWNTDLQIQNEVGSNVSEDHLSEDLLLGQLLPTFIEFSI